MGLPTHTLVFIATGFLIIMVIGLTILFRHLLRRSNTSPVQFGYNNQEEDGGAQHEDIVEEIRIWRILRTAPHIRTPMEKAACEDWIRRHGPLQL